MAIAHMQDGAGVRSVARRLHVSGPFITAQVNVLVKAGLVAKHPNPEDGRAVILSLTDIGEARLEAIAPEIQRANDTFFGPLSASEFRLLAGLAARLVESSELAVRSGAD
jgi:DNA-binding MarR family transcriptional regulator